MMKEITCHHIYYKYAEMEIHGTYTGPVSKNDVLTNFGIGHAHKFVYFNEGTFILIKYEDVEELLEY